MPLLEVDRLFKQFVRRRPLRSPLVVHAVNDVSFTVNEGETLSVTMSGAVPVVRVRFQTADDTPLPAGTKLRMNFHGGSMSSSSGCTLTPAGDVVITDAMTGTVTFGYDANGTHLGAMLKLPSKQRRVQLTLTK